MKCRRCEGNTIECIDAVILISKYIPSSNSLFYASNKLFEIKENGFVGVSGRKRESKRLWAREDVKRTKLWCACMCFCFLFITYAISSANSQIEKKKCIDKKWWKLGADCISWDGFLRFYYANRITFTDSTENFLKQFFFSACTWNSHRIVSPHETSWQMKKKKNFTPFNGLMQRK